MKLRLFLILLSFFIVCHNTNAQSGIYTTYEDFASGKIENTKDEISYSGNGFTGLTLKFVANDGSVLSKKPKEMWGFLFKGSLFRTYDNFAFVYIKDTGKVCFGINGVEQFLRVKQNKPTGPIMGGGSFRWLYFMANDLKSELFPMPFADLERTIPYLKKNYKAFKNAYPEHSVLYQCIDDASDSNEIKDCIKSYNKSSKK